MGDSYSFTPGSAEADYESEVDVSDDEGEGDAVQAGASGPPPVAGSSYHMFGDPGGDAGGAWDAAQIPAPGDASAAVDPQQEAEREARRQARLEQATANEIEMLQPTGFDAVDAAAVDVSRYTTPQAAPPPAPPPPPPVEPDAATAAAYDGVMAQLKDQVPENSGRWTATQAASFDKDTDFLDATGIPALDAAALDSSAAMNDALMGGGSYSAEDFATNVQLNADLQHAFVDADMGRNRYQQSTDVGDAASLQEAHARVDEGVATTLQTAEENPALFGIGMTQQQMNEAAEADAAGTSG